MRKFDYSFLKKISVPSDIMNSATSIYEMKAKAELGSVREAVLNALIYRDHSMIP